MAETRVAGRQPANRLVPALIRAPALHFVLLGALLFAVDTVWTARTGGQSGEGIGEPLVIGASEIDRMRRDFVVQNGFSPSPQQLAAAVDAAIEEEILYRGALAAGLDRDNESVRQRLVQLARFVADDPEQAETELLKTALELGLDRRDLVVRRQLSMMMRLAAARTPMADETAPDEAELETYLRAHPEPFARPARIKLTHVFFSEDRHGAAAQRRASRLLGRLRGAGLAPAEIRDAGDPFLLGHHLPWRSRTELANQFGTAFADAVVGLEPATWSGPVRSGYGWHLVRVDAARPGTVPPLAEIRESVLASWQEGRREWRVRETLDEMRTDYRIEVEWPAGDAPENRDGDDG